jgi:hypothetical protein
MHHLRMDTETNFDWVSLAFLKNWFNHLPFHVYPSERVLEKGLWDSNFQAISANTIATGPQDVSSFTF